MADLFAAGVRLATCDAPGLAECSRGSDDAGNAQLRSDRERGHSGCNGATGVGAPGIEVELAGAVVRISSGTYHAGQLTAVLRAVRASAIRS